ncbi:CDP-alcohol phosphatidyltransferase family protein [Haladaptatus sp. F3-133]|uniref:CDP-alcohol phosphatidyltransferase family protein n=1 Tax=Halorutilus salinus TaxID=2487751 RepID=A0A9Q4C6A3_9EURY|nr:CDP-alcohol phosphatidyltransferase family protein [Halorutilus salinus]MCX2819734.1 CDP-alcohol phosphatidyltransferase family protein [Halorutilus salinus]
MTLADLDESAEDAFEPFVSGIERLGATPNQVSVVSFLVAVTAAGSFYTATTAGYVGGSLLVAVSAVLDAVDGQLARRTGKANPQGDMLDHTLDRYSDLVLIAGIAGGVGAWAVGFFAVTGVFLTSYMGTQAQAVGAGRDYGGLLGRADRMALIILVGVVQPFVPLVEGLTALGWLLVFFGVVGNLTAVQRFRASWNQLS